MFLTQPVRYHNSQHELGLGVLHICGAHSYLVGIQVSHPSSENEEKDVNDDEEDNDEHIDQDRKYDLNVQVCSLDDLLP